MIELATLLAWSALALIVTLTPGPDTLLVAAHAARSGFRAGMAALLGIVTGVVWYGSLIAFGALSILVAVPALFLAVKIAGALYLAWLGAGMIWRALNSSPVYGGGGFERSEKPEGDVHAPLSHRASAFALRASADKSRADSSPPPKSQSDFGRPGNAGREAAGGGGAFRQGFFTNALNPKVALFYLAALPQFAGTGADAPMIGLMLLAIHAAMGFVWLSFIAFAAARARTVVWKSAWVRWLEGAVGFFFLGVAGRLALTRS